MTDKANILVMGPAGAGKSTLINAVIGKEVARINDGRHGTEKLAVYESDELNLRLIDSRGFGNGFWDSQKTIHQISNSNKKQRKKCNHSISTSRKKIVC